MCVWRGQRSVSHRMIVMSRMPGLCLLDASNATTTTPVVTIKCLQTLLNVPANGDENYPQLTTTGLTKPFASEQWPASQLTVVHLRQNSQPFGLLLPLLPSALPRPSPHYKITHLSRLHFRGQISRLSADS